MKKSFEQAILVGVGGGSETDLQELGRLAETAGAVISGAIYQKRRLPDPQTYVGKGKLKELKELIKTTRANLVLTDDELAPIQQRNLEDTLGCKVSDRTILILDIFAQHAHSAEGKIQVELAQYLYRLPRLRGWGTELSRLGGGIGTRGPGESKLESDRRIIERRVSKLKRDLKIIGKQRELRRKARKNKQIPMVALVGYTNAGKSSLMNALTNAGVLAEDVLFATLDSTARKLRLPSGRVVVASDTVGFIKKLPHDLVSAFMSTLEEVKQADLLLHVIDISDSNWENQKRSVQEVFDEIGVEGLPVLEVYNKIDSGGAEEVPREGLGVSAERGWGLPELLKAIDHRLSEGMVTMRLWFDYKDESELVSLKRNARIISQEHQNRGTLIIAELPENLRDKYSRRVYKAAAS